MFKNWIAFNKFLSRTKKSKKRNSKVTKSSKTAKEGKKSKNSKKKVKKEAPKGIEAPDVAATASTLLEEDVYDENDITTMLPNQPTLEQVGDSETLRVLEESRQGIIKIWGEIDRDEWTQSKEKKGAVLYRRDCQSGISFKRYTQVESDIDTALNCFNDLELAKKHNDKIDKFEVAETLTDDCRIIHQVNKGNMFASSRDF